MKSKLLAMALSLSLCLSLSPVVSASASASELNTTKDTATTITTNSKSNAYLNANAEKKAFEKKYGKSKVKLDENHPITITLDDGTKIEYSFKVTNEPSSKYTLASSTLAASSTKNLSVSKKYLGGLFNNVTVSAIARCKFSGRSVQITDSWATCDSSDATLSGVVSKVEQEYGYNNSYATCYSRGTVSRSNVIGAGSANFFLHMNVDPAGAAYLASDSY